MRKAAPGAFCHAIAASLAGALAMVAALAILFWIAQAYLDPGLRKAIIFSGYGMC